MFEGKHIHFSPTDNKPLCSYSGKLCRQRRLNGYAFCIRHILEDKSAPFKQCSYVTRNNSQKCLNAIPTNQDRGYCHSHMQVIGIIPKTERKSKAHHVQNKVDGSGSSVSSDKLSSSSLTNGSSTKKDPGAIFKFEEDSLDVTDVFSYKNGLSSATLNGKGKASKPRNTTKDIKNVKSQNGFGSTPKFTTKKITDKNKNVYTAVVPTTTGSCVNNNNKANDKVYHPKSKSTCWNIVEANAPSRPVGGLRTQKTATRFTGSELNSIQDSRQFEQLKTLKQLDKSMPSLGGTSTGGLGGDAKLQAFPRLAVRTSNVKSTTSINHSTLSPATNHPTTSDDLLESQFSTENGKSEIVSTSSSPPLITRSNNSIIIKTESQQAVAAMNRDIGIDNDKSESRDKLITSDRGVLFSSGSNNSFKSNFSITGSKDHYSSIDKDSRNRHEFLAQVRNSFKSQYKSVKKACKFSESCEKSGQQKLRDSLMRCVRIDSSICAQVLLGSGLKLPTLCSPLKTELETNNDTSRKQEYDDYDFVDTDGSLPIKNDALTLDQKSKKGKSANKPSTNTTAQKRGGKKNKDAEPACTSKISNGSDKKDSHLPEEATTRESKPKNVTALPSKRKLRRADALLLSPENSLGSSGVKLNNEDAATLNNNNAEQFDTSIAKKQRLELNGMAALETELGLSINEQSSSSHDERIPPSAHQNLNQSVGHRMGDAHHELHEILGHTQLSSTVAPHRNQGLETVLNSVGSSENAGTPDGVITDASFDSTFEHSTSSQPDCEFSEDDLENSFELQIDPEIESQASRLLEDNVLTEADFTELFPDNRMSDHKFGRNDLQELGMTGLEFDVNDIDYSLFANIFPNFPRSSQPESISISNQF